jgi:hypothetical protein
MEPTLISVDYFDSSALVKRYFLENGSVWVQQRCANPTRVILTADLSRVEVAAAFASKLRGHFITEREYQQARAKLLADCTPQYWLIPIEPGRIEEAIELTCRRRLRGYEAVHLAGAWWANRLLLQHNLLPLVLVTADLELLQAAQQEGLVTENPLSPISGY